MIKDQSTGQNIEVHLEMEKNKAPVAQRPTRVAYYLEKLLKKWIDQVVTEYLFEAVPTNEEMSWCSPLVV